MNPSVETRITWLKDELHLPVQSTVPNTEDSPSSVLPIGATLTEQAIERIFRDASDEKLLQLNRYLKMILQQRAKPVKVALSPYNSCFAERCCSKELRFEVYKPFVVKYLPKHQPSWVVSDRVIDPIAKYLAIAVPLVNPAHHVSGILNCDIAKVKRIISELVYICENEETTGYEEFFSMAVDDPYFIAAVERLIKQGKQPKDIVLVTINVPLGKKIKQRFDMNYGDYVELVDDD